MSDLLIIYVTGLCLQARANIVGNKGEKKGLLNNVSLLPQVSIFLFFFSSEILIKFMQMTLSPLEKCKCSPCIALWGERSAESDNFYPPGSVNSSRILVCCKMRKYSAFISLFTKHQWVFFIPLMQRRKYSGLSLESHPHFALLLHCICDALDWRHLMKCLWGSDKSINNCKTHRSWEVISNKLQSKTSFFEFCFSAYYSSKITHLIKFYFVFMNMCTKMNLFWQVGIYLERC